MNISEEGFSLVELLIATTVVMVVLTTLISGVSFAVKNSRYASEKLESARFAQDGLEAVRSLRDEMGWEQFSAAISSDIGGSAGVEYCGDLLPNDANEFVGLTALGQGECAQIAQTSFVRTLELNLVSAEQLEVDAVVSWQDGSKSRETRINSTLWQWK